MPKYFVALVAGFLVASGTAVLVVQAATSTPEKILRDEIKDKREALKDEIQDKRDALHEEAKEKRAQLKSEFEAKQGALKTAIKSKQDELKKKVQEVKKFVRRSVTLTGELKEVKGAAVPAEIVIVANRVLPKKNKNWEAVYPEASKMITVKLDEKTRIIRRYGGKSSLAELTVSDKLHIVGKVNEDGTITAQVVKDESIHATLRVHNGTIESIDAAASTFVLVSGKQKLTIKIDANTVVWVNGVKSTSADLKVGDKAHVRGVINNRTKVISATHVKVNRRMATPAPAPVTPTTTTSTAS